MLCMKLYARFQHAIPKVASILRMLGVANNDDNNINFNNNNKPAELKFITNKIMKCNKIFIALSQWDLKVIIRMKLSL